MRKVIDEKRILAELHKAVEIKGADHRVAHCTIFHDLKADETEKVPNCIVGQVLFDIVGSKKFQKVDSGFVRQPAESLGIELTEVAAGLLTAAQAKQDMVVDNSFDGLHTTWGEAVAYAEALYIQGELKPSFEIR